MVLLRLPRIPTVECRFSGEGIFISVSGADMLDGSSKACPSDSSSVGAKGKFDREAALQIICVGAFAGGIEALSIFFEAMPTESDCAFVVVLHLDPDPDPDRESEMAHVLSVHTAMSVVQIADGMPIVGNQVFVIATDTDVEVRDGILRVSKPGKPRGLRHPVDVLFRSLAREQQERSIAIVLSGTGSNGTDGRKGIRAEGGMSIAQLPETAKFDGMPISAIAAGLIGYILPPEEMPRTVLAYIGHGYISPPLGNVAVSVGDQTSLGQVIDFLRLQGGPDFRSYK
ncbi:chemotaxis protein CheB [Rhizobium sp. L245/93]|uniref:chemotaxis protein CheB n=1 Tax=Rhizobium sp. L245/93 TaxID=2819998 RepID=UPI001ADA2DFA|nr:chemotaxis protein CheB [Rhizobium sp. L245/93]MBO9172347.1 chemotaxis protein CheB [Rhizobium sp. L245/93]